jgi:hypothetical protein
MIEGETGLILHVPEAEPVVGRWRSEHDSSAPFGVPAHVTVLYPWIPFDQLTEADRSAVAGVVAGMRPLELTFASLGRFPGVLWLDPRPAEPIRALIRAVARRWPDYQPYGGEYGDEPVPHLTISDTKDLDELGHIVADVESALPLRSRVAELSLLVRRADYWELEQMFPFGRARSARPEPGVRDVAGSADEDGGERVDGRGYRPVLPLELGLDVSQ